ncbi:MAG: hypothetical protein U5L96_05980 [Owenweeksia sp.]|nr:hypothetical protein [Owenweeksia sp.]
MMRLLFMLIMFFPLLSKGQQVDETKPELYTGIPTNTLAETIGYVRGQEQALIYIADRYPHLTKEVNKAIIAFESRFGNSYDNMQADLKERLGSDYVKVDDSLRTRLENYFLNSDVSRTEAESFIQTVMERAAGVVESPYKEILLTYQYWKTPHSEYREGFIQKRCYQLSDNAGEFCISLPESWKEQSPDRPNILTKYVRAVGYGIDQFMIEIYELPTEFVEANYTDVEIGEAFIDSEVISAFIPEGTTIERKSVIKIDGQVGVYVVYHVVRQILEHNIQLKISTYFIIYSDVILKCTGFVGSPLNIEEYHWESTKTRHQRLKPLFDMIASSIVFSQKWEE